MSVKTVSGVKEKVWKKKYFNVAKTAIMHKKLKILQVAQNYIAYCTVILVI
jgi:hypothetical protein